MVVGDASHRSGADAIADLMAFIIARDGPSSDLFLTASKQEAQLTIQRLKIDEAVVLRNPGKKSVQIVWPENAPEALATITRVTMEPGAVSPRHSHARSEQIWIVERGSGRLLTANGMSSDLNIGDVIRTPCGEIHGVENSGLDHSSILPSPVHPRT